MTDRKLPNILITGTPGVGKSTLCYELAKQTNFEWLEVGKIAKEHQCYESYDDEYQCPILDEVKLLDELEGRVASGGKIVDYHSSELFPERWFDAVYVLRADTKTLETPRIPEVSRDWASLSNNSSAMVGEVFYRGYTGKKFDDNIQCEIFQTALEEAQEAYRAEIVHELQSNTDDDMSANLSTINNWIQKWKQEHPTH
ncbi:adenylate kinase isoenzyme 6-like [Homalodisca vitripennis]|uniref:adenylate kinase isoenzyme 6-like n=1 Tax=Homalodisca vitripennis TaxID=197043 RepID=UPI001EEB3037|nr:adenylate kinase isoenzyme 6-like [Homalodisca vitripennis]